MSDQRRSESPDFEFDDQGGRPFIESSATSTGFSQGQRVKYKTGGDTMIYKIKTKSGDDKYTLVTLENEVANSGMEVTGADLVAA